MNRFYAAIPALFLSLVNTLADPAQAQNEFTGNMQAFEHNRNPEVVLWLSIAYSENPLEFEYYLKQYPNGEYAEIAIHKLDYLKSTFEKSPLSNIKNHLASYPEGQYAALAIKTIEKAEANKKIERNILFILIPLTLIFLIYIYWHKKQK